MMENKLSGRGYNQYSIRVAKSIEEVQELRSIWEKWQCHPNADIDFYLTIVNERPEILRPHVILISSVDGDPKAIMVGRVEHQRFDIRIGYKKIFSPSMRILMIIYGGIIGDDSDVSARIFLSELMGELKKGTFDVVNLHYLQVNSLLYHIAKTKPTFLCRDHSGIRTPHWEMVLPCTYNDLLLKMESDDRYQLRRLQRYARALNRDFQGKVDFRICLNVDEVDSVCVNAEKIMKGTYQRGLGVGFFDNTENRRRLNLEAEKGRLRAYELWVNGRAVAFWIGSHRNNIFHLQFTGYDPDYKKYDPGMVLFLQMLEDLCKKGIQKVDFGFGDAFYKQRFGDQKWEEASVVIFSPTFKAIGINSIKLVINVISQYAEAILRKTNLYGWVKKAWRNRLSQS